MISDINMIAELLKSKSLLIFDFDGVLADSVEVKTEAFAQMYSQYGNKIITNVVNHHRKNGGMSRYEKFKFYHREYLSQDLSDHEIKLMGKEFSNLVVRKVIASNEIERASLFLEQNYKHKEFAINSATPEEEMVKIAKSRLVDHYFSLVYGSPASKEENLRKILKTLNYKKEHAVFFGDASSDMKAAENLDMDFIGIGKGIVKSLQNKKRHYHMNNFERITRLDT